MIKPHPSLLLVLDIDESLATDATRAEVSRTYGYIGSTVIRPHETPEDGEISNNIEMHVKLTGATYMREHTEEADSLWNDVIERWLYNQFHNVGNHLQIYNRRQRELNNDELYFDWLKVVLDGGGLTVNVRLNSVSSLPPETAEVVDTLRQALCDGSIDAGVDTVYIPSPDSFASQVQAWEAAAPEREAAEAEAEKAAEEAAKEEEEAEKETAEESFGEAPDLVEPDPEQVEEENWLEEMKRKYSLPAPDFDIDYSVWGIVSPDGEIADFDSKDYLKAEE